MYFTNSKPLGGRSKFRYWDFIVKEVYYENNKNNVSEIIDFETDQQELYKFPKDQKDYLYFNMQKINTDLQHFVKNMALVLRCGKTKISFAGLKDKRGVTSQRFCIYNPDVELMKKYNRNMVKLFNFRWSDEKLEIGSLIGNDFILTIRNIDHDEKKIKKIVTDFEKQIVVGIPNNFGEQRFGGPRDVTHEVGRLLIQEKTKDAVMLYLTKTYDREDEEVKKVREIISNGEFVEAIKQLPKRSFRYERAILHALIKNPNDFHNAWLQLPKNITYLFSHAYQSHLFNKYLELRIKKFGKHALDAQKGDVLDDEGNVMGPLFGYQFELATDKVGELEKEILKEENMTLADFRVNNFPQMSVSGARRKIKLDIHNFKFEESGKDEHFEDKNYAKISFWLEKGNYATTVLDELIKDAKIKTL